MGWFMVGQGLKENEPVLDAAIRLGLVEEDDREAYILPVIAGEHGEHTIFFHEEDLIEKIIIELAGKRNLTWYFLTDAHTAKVNGFEIDEDGFLDEVSEETLFEAGNDFAKLAQEAYTALCDDNPVTLMRFFCIGNEETLQKASELYHHLPMRGGPDHVRGKGAA